MQNNKMQYIQEEEGKKESKGKKLTGCPTIKMVIRIQVPIMIERN